MNKKLLIMVLSVGILAAGVFGTTKIFAEDSSQYPHDLFIQRLVDKFGLNKDDVTKVFEEEHVARQEEMKKRFNDRLTQAVTEGKLTDEQKQKIIVKHEEMQQSREQNMNSWQTISWEERQSVMESKREEMKKWADENSIDMQYLMGIGNGGGMGRRGHMGQ